MKDNYTRDVSKEMIDALNGVFKPFVDFVKKHKELALCFRGNDSAYGKVIIYWNNHVVWELSIQKNKQAKVEINANHARFMNTWADNIEVLMGLGFKPTKSDLKNKEFKELNTKGKLINRTKKKNEGGSISYYYNIINFSRILNKDDDVKGFVEDSYNVIKDILKDFFNPSLDKNNKPINYFKEYYKKHNPNIVAEDPKIEDKYATKRVLVEKIAQQDLFLHNHNFKSGLFIYDLEFAQPNGKKFGVAKANKPDMYGIRFDEKGAPVSICMVEVKSTESALKGDCSLKKHLEGMKEYCTKWRIEGNIRLMEDRKREAYRILDQYREICLYDVNRNFIDKLGKDEDEFIGKLDEEIIFVLTNEVYMETKYTNKEKVKDILAGFEPYNDLKCGEYCKIIAPKKSSDNKRAKIDVCIKRF